MKVQRKFLQVSGRTSTGIEIPFEEVSADDYSLNQTMLYVVKPDEIILRFHLNVGKMQFKVPTALLSHTDQGTWQMAQVLKVIAENDCIVKRIDVQLPVGLAARRYLKEGKVGEWYKLGVPEVLLRAKTLQNFSFPNGLITNNEVTHGNLE
jgi:hypothetical protein